jgi:hypothetical protein
VRGCGQIRPSRLESQAIDLKFVSNLQYKAGRTDSDDCHGVEGDL